MREPPCRVDSRDLSIRVAPLPPASPSAPLATLEIFACKIQISRLYKFNVACGSRSAITGCEGIAMKNVSSSLGANPVARSDAALEYDHRMLVNALATVAITFMIVTGYWVVSTLAETMAH
jgi:hypothetical protein